MKRNYLLKTIVLWIVTLLPLWAHAEDLGYLRLSQLEGDVQIQSKGATEWFPATINLPIQTGDRLWVPKNAWAQVETREGSVIRIDEESSLEIQTMEKDSLQMYLSQGQAYLNFKKVDDAMLQMDTPISSIRIYDSSTFNVALAENGNTDLSVFRGTVNAENKSGEVSVDAGKMLSMDEGLPSIMDLGPPSEWEKWNRDWDESLAVDGDSEKYLPQELTGYERDLNKNGKWIETSEYGNVWTPTTHISDEWAPYREGRWVWIGDDYVWIASEPWGWAPYHYGRWAHISSHGWCWVPPPRNEVYWGPGYVSWVATENDVAWVPLAPAEVYYGYGNYGPHSVNIVNVNIATVVVPGSNYRNAHVRDAVTVIPRDTFLTGKRHAVVGHRENPFLREKINVGRPRIEPGRITKMPTIREIPKVNLPPANIRSLPGRTAERPMVRERNRSSFTPTVAPRTLTPTIRMNPDAAVKQGKEQNVPGIGGRKQLPGQNVTPRQFRGRQAIDREAVKFAPPPASIKPHGAPPPAPAAHGRPVRKDETNGPVVRERPQLPGQNVTPRQFRGRQAIDREAVKSAPAPAPARPRVAPAHAPARHRVAPAPAPARPRVAPAPGQPAKPDPEALKRLKKKQQGGDKKEKQ
ncbi:MAG: FecR family protein [Deltaproteobacteria bacterium]|nr:FecR family protein [Deltaproteobacteria bacterium]